MDVVICGGGVIGASIAYFLSCRGVKPVVIERAGLACAASGKSGGFLARDWCDGSPLAPLGRRSFALHAELADSLGNDWGYRGMTTYGGTMGEFRTGRRTGPDWVSPEVAIESQLGSTRTTAQVQPAAFTAGMMRKATAHGAELRIGGPRDLRCADDEGFGKGFGQGVHSRLA